MIYESEWAYKKGLDILCDAIKYAERCADDEAAHNYAKGRVDGVIAMLKTMDFRVPWCYLYVSDGYYLSTHSPTCVVFDEKATRSVEVLWKHYLKCLGVQN